MVRFLRSISLNCVICWLLGAIAGVITVASAMHEKPGGPTPLDRGFKACEAGVPADANPYAGQRGTNAVFWLDGWIVAKSAAKPRIVSEEEMLREWKPLLGCKCGWACACKANGGNCYGGKCCVPKPMPKATP